MGLLWLLACGTRWTEGDAVAPTLARLDADKNGTVTGAEYDAVLFRGAPFGEVDRDKNGALSADELLAIVSENNPADLTVPRTGPQVVRGARSKGKDKTDGPRPVPGTAPKGGPSLEPSQEDARRVRSEAQYVVRMTFESLCEEVRAVAPTHELPTDEEIKFAAGTSDLRTAESRALLLRLEAASDAVGAGFPASLRAAVLVTRPVVASFVPADEPEDVGGVGPWGMGPGGGRPRGGQPNGPPGGVRGVQPGGRGGAPTDPRTPAGTP